MKNGDIETLIKMENLIGHHENRLFCKEPAEPNADGEYVRFDPDTGVTKADFLDFWQIIEDLLIEKRKASERSNAYNKAHPDKHREQNREYARRKKAKIAEKRA